MSTETEERVQPNEPYYRRGEQARNWGMLLLLVGLVWLVFALLSRVPFVGFGGGNVERRIDLPPQTFTATRVVISGVHDTVTLIPGGDDVRVTATKYGFGWNADAAEQALGQIDLQTEQRGDTLNIEVRRESSLGTIVGRSPYVALEVAVPAGVAVETSLTSGDVTIEDVQSDIGLTLVSGNAEIDGLTGALRANLTSGTLEVTDLRGQLNASSVGGDISVSGDLATAEIGTTSGDVILEGISGSITATTISGSIQIRDAEDAQLNLETTSGDVRFAGTIGADSRVSTISGDVELQLEEADLRIDARTLSGDLDLEENLGVLERERRRLSGNLGAGGPLLEISTSSGDVTIEQ